MSFEIQVYLNGLNPDCIRVEIYADEIENDQPFRQEAKLVRQLSGEPHSYIYHASVSANVPETAYTARIVPFFPGVAVPLEEGHILWQK